MVSNLRDISRRKQAEQSILESRDRAEEASRAKTEFLSRMSHELRTPMNAIIGFGQLLEMKPEKLDDDQKQYLDYILKGGHHLMELINEVLDLSKIEAGKIELNPESVDPEKVLREVLELSRALVAQNQIEIRILPNPDPGIEIFTDPKLLKQVLLNLVSNAIKYNKVNGWVEIQMKLEKQNRFVITVTDSGLGISPEAMEEVFEPFNRAGAEDSGKEGTGIGLTITKHLVELLGGEIFVRSTPGQGSCFMVELPYTRGADKSRAASAWN